jgi:hypothetical protein
VHFVLHQIHPDVIDNNIAIYIAENLGRIGKEFLSSSDWPISDWVDGLV